MKHNLRPTKPVKSSWRRDAREILILKSLTAPDGAPVEASKVSSTSMQKCPWPFRRPGGAVGNFFPFQGSFVRWVFRGVSTIRVAVAL